MQIEMARFTKGTIKETGTSEITLPVLADRIRNLPFIESTFVKNNQHGIRDRYVWRSAYQQQR